MTDHLSQRALSGISGLLLGLGAVLLATWLDRRFGTRIIERRPWIILVFMIVALLVLIAALLIYGRSSNAA